jgi:secreted Zn-dependent insulinase-like peptidase
LSESDVKVVKAKKPVKAKAKAKKKVVKKKVVKVEKVLTAFDKLTDKHKLFVKAYIQNFAVGYKAYMQIYPKVTYESARALSTVLLANINVKNAIAEEYSRIWADKDTEVEKSKTYAMIHNIGESDISDIVDMENGTLTVKDLKDIPAEARQWIQSIEYAKKETQNGTDENIKVRLHPKLPALEMRAKIQKLIDKEPPQQLEITIIPAKRPDKKEESEE